MNVNKLEDKVEVKQVEKITENMLREQLSNMWEESVFEVVGRRGGKN